MIIFKTKEELETREGFPNRAFRKALVLESYGKGEGFFFGVDAQYQPNKSQDWHSCNWPTGLSVTRHLSWGSNHGWYDGPKCSFSIGFLHFLWANHHCKKCLNE